MSKYHALRDFLVTCAGEELAISFDDLERATGITLPYAARHHRQWWSNGTNAHTQAVAWMEAGYRVTDLDLKAGTVRFVPDAGAPSAAGRERFDRVHRYEHRKSTRSRR
ncbi:MAG: hypothetical protein KF757_10780 [Phycisphaeraceae bacterium]|nr:hypothetical protein [Phycisphaeraceae bacterium]MCW5764241.1 hypothetical protein [Phycisphaeraceae bacterium]